VSNERVPPLHGQDGAKGVIPNFARHAEAELEVLVVVCEVVLLHLPHVLRELRVVESVMHAVVQDIKGEGS